jgi:hypothetical protein
MKNAGPHHVSWPIISCKSLPHPTLSGNRIHLIGIHYRDGRRLGRLNRLKALATTTQGLKLNYLRNIDET